MCIGKPSSHAYNAKSNKAMNGIVVNVSSTSVIVKLCQEFYFHHIDLVGHGMLNVTKIRCDMPKTFNLNRAFDVTMTAQGEREGWRVVAARKIGSELTPIRVVVAVVFSLFCLESVFSRVIHFHFI